MYAYKYRYIYIYFISVSTYVYIYIYVVYIYIHITTYIYCVSRFLSAKIAEELRSLESFWRNCRPRSLMVRNLDGW